MLGLLTRITDKKLHVANIEASGLTGENGAAVAKWLDEIRDIQVGIGSLIGDISGRLSLSQDGSEKSNAPHKPRYGRVQLRQSGYRRSPNPSAIR